MSWQTFLSSPYFVFILFTLKNVGKAFRTAGTHLFQNIAHPGFRFPGTYGRNLTTENFASMYIYMGTLNTSHRQKKNIVHYLKEKDRANWNIYRKETWQILFGRQHCNYGRVAPTPVILRKEKYFLYIKHYTYYTYSIIKLWFWRLRIQFCKIY